MDKNEYYNYRNQWVNPPGTYYDIIRSPNGFDEALEVAILNEHRFAFFYWLKWTNALDKKHKFKTPPSVVTIDWHNDLAPLDESEKEMLDNLNKEDLEEVTYFTWGRLHPHNDGHIKAAIYLNLINNVYVISKQPVFDENDLNEIIEDKFGNIHNIIIYREFEKLTEELKKSNDIYYLDIDLDYFLDSNDSFGDDGVIMSKEKIENILNPQNNLFKTILLGLQGFTIAREPKWCNGLKNSNFLIDIINDKFFKNTLLTKNTNWNL